MPVSPCRGAEHIEETSMPAHGCRGAEHIEETSMPAHGCRGAEHIEEKTAEEALQEPLTALDERELSFLRS